MSKPASRAFWQVSFHFARGVLVLSCFPAGIRREPNKPVLKLLRSVLQCAALTCALERFRGFLLPKAFHRHWHRIESLHQERQESSCGWYHSFRCRCSTWYQGLFPRMIVRNVSVFVTWSSYCFFFSHLMSCYLVI